MTENKTISDCFSLSNYTSVIGFLFHIYYIQMQRKSHET